MCQVAMWHVAGGHVPDPHVPDPHVPDPHLPCGKWGSGICDLGVGADLSRGVAVAGVRIEQIKARRLN
jgi:hypothetical protein